jgi:hypothetical protein
MWLCLFINLTNIGLPNELLLFIKLGQVGEI